MSSIGIYLNNINDNLDIIQKIKTFFDKYDFVLFNDTNQSNEKHATLPTFYMKFYDGSIVFLSIEDYLIYKETIKSDAILLLDIKTAIDSKIDRSIIKGCKILSYNNNNNLELLNNYGL